MKEEIYTIPVMDGFKEDCECPFCAMKRTLENNTINYVLSPSYMEEDVRGETNAKGFCTEHTQRLYNEGNALGLALMLHSHMKDQHETIEKLLKTASAPKKLFGKKQTIAGRKPAVIQVMLANRPAGLPAELKRQTACKNVNIILSLSCS